MLTNFFMVGFILLKIKDLQMKCFLQISISFFLILSIQSSAQKKEISKTITDNRKNW
jgi:hypothetical protein